MKRRVLWVAVTVAIVGGCTDAPTTSTEPLVLPVFSHHPGAGHGPENFGTHATGAEEVPARDTRAQGQATFQLSPDGTELSYQLIVANINNVLQAHIHVAPAGATGPIVLWLYPSAPPAQLIPGRFQGVLGQGVATDADLVGPLAGGTLADLMDVIRAGNAYVNVHTSQFPPGEIRGQID